MPIKIRCQCGKSLNAPDSAAGKAVKCPGCGKAIRVPAGGAVPPAKSAATKPAAAKTAAPKRSAQAAPVTSAAGDLGSLFDEEGFSAKVEAVCPHCRVAMPANAVLCTKCGYHKESGTVLEGHKTIGVDIDRSTVALEKAAQDMVRERELQAELIKGGGMPWWMLVMVLVIGGGGLGVAVLGVNAANQETEVEGPGVLASVFMLTGVTLQFATFVCVGIVIIHAFKQTLVKGLLAIFTFPFYYFYHVVTNFKDVGKVFVAGLLMGVAGSACYYYGANMPDVAAEQDDGGLTTAFGTPPR